MNRGFYNQLLNLFCKEKVKFFNRKPELKTKQLKFLLCDILKEKLGDWIWTKQ